MFSRSALLAICGLCSGAGACTTFEFDGFLGRPIPLRVTTDITSLPVKGSDGAVRTAIVDVGSALTLLDVSGDGSLDPAAEVRFLDPQDTTVTRLIARNFPMYDLPVHPVGTEQPIIATALIGASLLSNFVVGLRYIAIDRAELVLSQEMAGNNAEIASDCPTAALLDAQAGSISACRAALPEAIFGGGRAFVSDRVDDLPATRWITPACVGAGTFDSTDANAPPVPDSGLSLTAVVSSGIGRSLITRDAFERLRRINPTLAEQPGQVINFAYGPETVAFTSIPALSLVGDLTSKLAACGELGRRRRHLQTQRTQTPAGIDAGEPGAPAISITGNIDFAIVEIDTLLLDGLRQELRPQVADIDLVIAGSTLRRFDSTFDYRNRRLIMSCGHNETRQSCLALPLCGIFGAPDCF